MGERASDASLPAELERRVWRAYFRDHVRPELLGRFGARWIEVCAGGWSARRTATTVRFDRTRVVRLTEPLRIPFPSLDHEADAALIVFGPAGRGREGYSRRWSAERAGCPYWRCWNDPAIDLPCRTLLVDELLARFVDEGDGGRKRKRRGE